MTRETSGPELESQICQNVQSTPTIVNITRNKKPQMDLPIQNTTQSSIKTIKSQECIKEHKKTPNSHEELNNKPLQTLKHS